ncbi:hypothetical protein CUT44_11525 [Streptomyces carminius]|uniref:Uncharacterized protein n=1 Tax=Streptomyces carminius TaxID=2665496 RepID=A0A2M8LYI5_9ACTN|nr:hypothetical protein [Streptomyces carminius]PJE97037.1 hypothetical protein CUT44_14780 [Streptomyces carminius]PJE97746.1 hypothetical protein CUT44_11525 [Streptomyces carminius]
MNRPDEPDRRGGYTRRTADPRNESEITRDHGERAGRMSGTARSQRSGRDRDREQDARGDRPHEDGSPEWGEEDRPQA